MIIDKYLYRYTKNAFLVRNTQVLNASHTPVFKNQNLFYFVKCDNPITDNHLYKHTVLYRIFLVVSSDHTCNFNLTYFFYFIVYSIIY